MSPELRERDGIRLDLTSSDGEVRRLAVERLGAQPREEAVPGLLSSLGDKDWRVRKAAVARLVAAPAEWEVAKHLIEALADGDNPGRRNSAVEALVCCGPRVVSALLEASFSEDSDVRKLIVDALAEFGDEQATSRLLEMLRDVDVNVRAAAADALGAAEGQEVVDRLVGVVARRGEQQLVRFAALRALARMEAELDAQCVAPALSDPILRPEVFGVLAFSRDDASIEVLMSGLLADSRVTREAAMEALLRQLGRLEESHASSLTQCVRETARRSERLVADALERLQAASLPTRLVLVQFLGVLRCKEAVLPILAAARDEALMEVALSTLASMSGESESALDAHWPGSDVTLSSLACEVLGRTGGERGQLLLQAALEHPESELRAVAARALGNRGCSPAMPALVRRLEVAARHGGHGSEEELEAIIEALTTLARPGSEGGSGSTTRAIALLTSCLGGGSEPVRRVVAGILGQIGRPEDAEVVTLLLKDPSADVRRSAVQALSRLEPGQAPEALRLALADESHAVRIAAAAALGTARGSTVVDDLRCLASDEDERVRAAAVHALGCQAADADAEGASGKARELVEAALADRGLVALAAVEGLEAIGGAGAARAASVLLQSPEPELVRAAVACVGAHGDAAELDGLAALVSHPDWAVRAEAIQWLGERSVVRAIPSLLRRLETEQDSFVRDVMLRTLARLEG